ncbi:protein LTO1 homolog [Frankliniella occidentalis]|uniref:Protein LTO1 homolog n=1 Tax=Frankliniella occidentalis TaxID=133901 RepID=A0A6J1SCL3_FRAOC|nr:protein LTO1 homolog [Frankliniella occidentalis]
MEGKDLDINDVFDSIAQTEERLWAEGYRDGLESGRKEGSADGFHLGYHRGAEIGAELGFYAGFVEAWLTLGSIVLSEKARQSLQKVLQLTQSFPRNNVDSIDIFDSLEVVRISYRRACSLLKTNICYPEAPKTSF